MTRFHKWRQLAPDERVIAAYAAGVLAVLPVLLRLAAFNRLLSSRAVVAAGGSPVAAGRVAALVEGVALHLPWTTTCLHRAVAAAWLMQRAGWHGELVVGVRKSNSEFAAHAWLEYRGAAQCRNTDGYQRLASWPY